MADTQNRRFISRKGEFNVARKGRHRGSGVDGYHWMLVSPWRWTLLAIVIYYVGLNVLFAFLFMLGGDCITGARPGNFLDYFSFSVQTMSSIGYGVMSPRTDYAHVMVAVEALVGLVSIAMATGIMFAKFSRPTARIAFSEKAIIAPFNGQPHLMFRLANMRSNEIVDATLHVAVVRAEVTEEGERISRLHELELMRSRSAMFVLSWTVFHALDENSPLHGLTLEDWLEDSVEVVVSVTGVDGTFNQTIHARHSYTAEDVHEGVRFVDVMTVRDDGIVEIDYTHFHEIERA